MSHLRQFPQIIAPYCIALEKSIGAIIFRTIQKNDGERDVEFLLMRYPHGHWEFPRGHVEAGENNEHMTMYREIREETGLDKRDLEIDETYREHFHFSYRARGDERKDRMQNKKCLFIRKTVVFYLAQTIKTEVTLSNEHQEFIWLPFKKAIKKLTYANAKKVITKANIHLHQKH